MADNELAQIRSARLAQLKQQGGAGGAGDGQANEQDQKRPVKQQESEARESILGQILEPAAADRVGRIRMVKESRATDVENRLIMLAKSGQLRSKVTEDQLKDMLASLTEHERSNGGGGSVEKVVVVRKSGWDEDDLDDLIEDM